MSISEVYIQRWSMIDVQQYLKYVMAKDTTLIPSRQASSQRTEEGDENILERHGWRTIKDCEVGVAFLLSTARHISRDELQGCVN